MHRPRVGIYDYYLDSFGGGEKDVCTMAEALSGGTSRMSHEAGADLA